MRKKLAAFLHTYLGYVLTPVYSGNVPAEAVCMLMRKLLLLLTICVMLHDSTAMAARRRGGRRGVRRPNRSNSVLFNSPFRNRNFAFNRFNPFADAFGFGGFGGFGGYGNNIRGFDPRAPFFGVDQDGTVSSDNRLLACGRIAEASGFERGRLLQQSHAAGIDCSEFTGGARRPIAAPNSSFANAGRPAGTPPSPSRSSGVASGSGPDLPPFQTPPIQSNPLRGLRAGESAVCGNPLQEICKTNRQGDVQAKAQQRAQAQVSLVSRALSQAGLTAEELGDSSNTQAWIDKYRRFLQAFVPMMEQKDPVAKGNEVRQAMLRAVSRESAKIKSLDPRDPIRLQFEAQESQLQAKAVSGPPIRSYGANLLALLNSDLPPDRKATALVSAVNTCGADFTRLNAVNSGGNIFLCSGYLNEQFSNDEQLTRVVAHEKAHDIDSRTQRFYTRYGQCNNLPEHELNEASADFWANSILAERMANQDPLTVAQNAFEHYCNPPTTRTIPTSALAQAALDRKRAKGPDEHSEGAVRIKDLFANFEDVAEKFGCQGGTGKEMACGIGGQKSLPGRTATASRADLPTGIVGGI